ncbi:MAG: carotenoid biosynthesis protein [Spirochaetales bacterium]
MIDAFLELYRPITAPGVLIAIWVFVMINVPVVRWIAGEGAERIGITAGVITQSVAVITLIALEVGWLVVIVIVLVPVLGWLSEAIGSHTGIPFGEYLYTDVLQPQVAHVPIIIPFAWLMMMPPSWAIGQLIAPDVPLLAWAVSAAAFTTWDLYLDPQMVNWRFWQWKKEGFYQGIPVTNYIGWFFVSFIITAAVDLVGRLAGLSLLQSLPVLPLAVIFVITWALQFVGQFFFWKLRVSAITGLVAMGAFVIAAFLIAQ